jgi:V/A-type H+/Na+-transporting ATPase subunit C
MGLLAGGGFDYGNTRLRARRAALLGRADYERLAELHGDALREAIQAILPAPDGPLRQPSDAGLHGLHQAVSTQWGHALEQMRAFYAGPAREIVDLMLSPFDTHNVVAVLRGAARGRAAAERAGLVPVGWLREPLAVEALRVREPAAVIDLLARSTPHRAQARTLHDALGDFERTDNVATLERSVVAGDTARRAAGLSALGAPATRMLHVTRQDIDDRNLLIALRARAALLTGADAGAAPGDPLLPGGSLPARWFTAVMHAPAPGGVLGTAGRGRWQAPLRRWTASGDLPALQRALERHAIAEKMALFRTGDPLGIDIPLAYSAAVHAQARNLRLLAEAAVGHVSADAVQRELYWPKEQP